MKRILQAFALVCAVLFADYAAHAQNYTAVTASQIGGSGNLLATGQLCFLGTDANNKSVNFQIGGGGQVVTSKICTTVTNGTITGFQVPNPLLTIPMAIRYHITVYNQFGTPVIDDPLAWICSPSSCSTFNFDTYVPTVGPPFQQSIATLAVQNLQVTNSCTMTGTTGCGGGGGGATLQTNGVNNTSQSTLNFQDTTYIHWSNPSLGNEQATLQAIPYSFLTGTPVLPSNTPSVAHQFFISYTSATGAFGQAQPAFTDISGTATKAQLPATAVYTDQANTFGAFLQVLQAGANFNLVDPTDTTKKVQFDLSNIATATTRAVNIPNANSTTAQSISVVAHNFLTGMSAQGLFSQAQPACGDLSNGGSLCSSSAALAQTITKVTHQWLDSYSATTGLYTQSQPAFGDVSGSASCAQLPALTGDATTSAGSCGTTVGRINGISLAGLATGLVKNTTTTGVPSIAVAGTDYVPPTSGSVILKGNGSGGTASATGHDVAVPLACPDSSGSGTAQVCNTSPTFTPASGDCVLYTTTTANTGTALTLNVNSLGVKSVAKWQGITTLVAGDVPANDPVLACYNGTVWNLATIGNAPSGGGSGTINSGTINGAAYYSGATAVSSTAAGKTGQSLVATNAAAPAFSSPGVADGNGAAPVTTTPYAVQCDSSTAMIDRVTTIPFQTGANVVNMPDPTTTGCGGNFAVSLIDDGAGALTVNRGGTATFSIFDGVSNTDGATSFTLANGDHATLNNGRSGVWEVRIFNGNASSLNGTAFSGTNGNLVKFGASNTPGDSGIAAANVTQTTATPAANQICVYGSTAKTCTPTTTLPTAAMPALTGDVTSSAGSTATTVVKINGGSVPASANVLGTNSSSQPIAATSHMVTGPLNCADTSLSGTAQVCNTSPTFTPAANDCIIYTTTTANTGTGLTLNVNSLGAKSVAKWLSTTTLAAGDVPANKYILACYDGTNWELATIGNAPSGGGGGTTVTVAGSPISGTTANLNATTPALPVSAYPDSVFTTFQKDTGSPTTNISGYINPFAIGRYRKWYAPNGSSTSVTGFGDLASCTGGTGTATCVASSPTTSDPAFFNIGSDATASGDSGFFYGQNVYHSARNPYIRVSGRYQQNTAQRDMIGLWSGDELTGFLQSDTPGNATTGNYLAFRCSTNVPDTNWQLLAKATTDAAPTVQATSPTVACGTTAHTFEIYYDSTNHIAYFWIDGTSVGTITKTLASGVLNIQGGMATLATAVKNFNWYEAQGSTN